MHASPEVPERFVFADDGRTPNHPSYPVLLYKSAVAASVEDKGAWLEERYLTNGWSGTWRAGVYAFTHYHSTAHEVLGVSRGSAVLQLGGDDGRAIAMAAGDVVALPAGTGHRCLRNSDDFEVVGAYPEGQDPDLLRAGEGEIEAAREAIRAVPEPSADPLHGASGPLKSFWSSPVSRGTRGD